MVWYPFSFVPFPPLSFIPFVPGWSWAHRLLCLSLVGLGLQVHTQLHLVKLCTFDKCPSSGILLGWPKTDYVRSIIWNQQLLEMREGLRPRQPLPLSDNKARRSQGPELCWLCDILRQPSWQSYFVYASLIQCFMPRTLWGGRWQGSLGKMPLCFSFSFALIEVTNCSALELLFYIQQWKLFYGMQVRSPMRIKGAGIWWGLEYLSVLPFLINSFFDSNSPLYPLCNI